MQHIHPSAWLLLGLFTCVLKNLIIKMIRSWVGELMVEEGFEMIQNDFWEDEWLVGFLSHSRHI